MYKLKIESKKLIVNADDFGWSEDTCKATIECMEAGLVTSATIMTGCVATDTACKYAAENSHRFSFGLHFNIVDKHRPLLASGKSLMESTNKFRDSDRQRIQALFYQLNANELQREFIAQLETLKEKGVKITHVDSHGHLHKFPAVFTAIKKIIEDNNIKWVRRPQNLYDSSSKISTKFINFMCTPFFLNQKKSDYFFAISDRNPSWFEDFINRLPNGITELAVHPGYNEEWRYSETIPLLTSDIFSLLTSKKIELIHH